MVNTFNLSNSIGLQFVIVTSPRLLSPYMCLWHLQQQVKQHRWSVVLDPGHCNRIFPPVDSPYGCLWVLKTTSDKLTATPLACCLGRTEVILTV